MPEMSYLGRLYLGFLSAHNEFCRSLTQSNDELTEVFGHEATKCPAEQSSIFAFYSITLKLDQCMKHVVLLLVFSLALL